MSDENSNILIVFKERIRQVLAKCTYLQQENAKLIDEKQLVKKQLDEAREEINQLKAKNANLKMVRTITATSVNVEEARSKLLKMVREVDKCINLMK